jgi:hypothetical protein
MGRDALTVIVHRYGRNSFQVKNLKISAPVVLIPDQGVPVAVSGLVVIAAASAAATASDQYRHQEKQHGYSKKRPGFGFLLYFHHSPFLYGWLSVVAGTLKVRVYLFRCWK